MIYPGHTQENLAIFRDDCLIPTKGEKWTFHALLALVIESGLCLQKIQKSLHFCGFVLSLGLSLKQFQKLEIV